MTMSFLPLIESKREGKILAPEQIQVRAAKHQP
jgi:hypothetical protein